MSFAKSKKALHQQNKFLPPPGYYDPYVKSQKKQAHNFNRGERFHNRPENFNPGPGAYMSNDKQIIRKRLLQDSTKKQPLKAFGTSAKEQSDIKISSIPSIPKKSATRVYEQLAPGILILHQEEYENSNIGPGSYDVSQALVKKKTPGVKIQPQHRRRFQVIDQQPEIKVPTIAEQLRQEKRQLYKQNLYKSSNVNKNDINSSDLCLETIILREKLLRGDDVPPPGYYYNEDVYSTFKKNQIDKPPELQALGGKEERFKDNPTQNLGPGAYSVKEQPTKKGGFIAKNTKIDIDVLKKMFDPGPGAYEIRQAKIEKQQPKGNCPPIFGAGCKRFSSAPKSLQQTPGPGSYQIDKRRSKKAKYIKVRKDFYQSQPIKKEELQMSNPLGFMNRPMEEHANYSSIEKKSRKQKNTFYFKSKVDRFLGQKSQIDTGPGAYEVNSSGFAKATYNKGNDGYVGNKSQRFDDVQIRPNIGPGTYYSGV